MNSRNIALKNRKSTGISAFIKKIADGFNVISGSDQIKSDSFLDISFSESYATKTFEIENVDSYYKLISKISAIPKANNEIAETIISQGWKIQEEKTEKEIKTIPDELRLLIEQPHPLYAYDEFISLILMDLHIGGNIFSYLVKSKEYKRTIIQRLDPQFVQWHNGEWVENNPNGGTEKLDERYLIQVKLMPDTYDPRWGKGIVAQNVTLFQNCIDMLNFRQSYYKNGCFTTGVLAVENAGAMDEMRLKEKIRERNQGANNVGEPMIISGKATYHQLQLDPTTLKISQELMIRYREVLDAFGIPRYLHPGLLEGGQKYNNHVLQDEHYMKKTIIPRAKKIEKIFTNISKRYNPRWEFKFDIHAEQYDSEEISAMVADGTISREEARELRSLPPTKDENMKIHFVPAGVRPIDQAAEEPEPIDLPGVPGQEPPSPPAAPNKPKPSEPKPPAPKPDPKKKVDHGRSRERSWRDEHYLSAPEADIWTKEELSKSATKRRIRQDFVLLNEKTRAKKSKESKIKAQLYLIDSYSNILANVAQQAAAIDEAAKKGDAKTDYSPLVEEIYKSGDDLKKLEKITMPIYQSVGEATFANTANILTLSIPFAMTDPGVAKQINLLRKDGPLVTTTTRGKIAETLSAGISAGKTHNEIAKDIWLRFVDDNNDLAEEFAKIYRKGVKPQDFDAVMSKGGKLQSRATLIARTEVGRANRLFARESMEQSKVIANVTIINCEPDCPICAPHQNVPVSFAEADSISNLHPNCTGTIVPGEISTD